jgi:hypothetical protein
MVLPASFSATRSGYNAYLKALGINPKNSEAVIMLAIPFEQFKSINRQTIDDKIAEAGTLCEMMYNNYIDCEDETGKAFYEARWDHFSKKFISLVNEKHSK